ncbi:Squalene/phytoene synthase-domain-containing protein [Sphaerosporella brunnea]|uniref:Squalene/phytoene synthase-domain-containing protein n=1 Tax=Sphaerosporella brunnea TaxID=1250544 RepID=A0A5J5EJX5_9PEZI|nr:Squalene/phytoene synthase-domain-containing protein [Sphaerosporella brunnea]
MPPRPALPLAGLGRVPAARRLAQHQRAHSTAPAAQPPKLTSPDAARAYCLSLLQRSDFASSLLTPLQHPLARDAHLAIRAFNVDIAAVDGSVSNVTVGKMRMQFWRDAVAATFAGQRPPAEPVAVLLAKVLHSDGAPLSKSWFARVISAREQYLGSAPFPSIDALESYAENTYGSLHYLALESVHQHSATLDHIGSHVGKAEGIAAVLRGIPLLATSGTGGVVLPLDVCAEHNLRQEDVLRMGGNAPGLKDAVFKVATLANDHLITARKMLEDSKGEGKQASAFATFLPAVPTSLYLQRLEKADFDPFSPSLMKRAWTLPWRLYRAVSHKQF